jgi:hypothetical protein
MTDEDALQTLIRWAWTFGCDIIEADKDELQADGRERRGVIRMLKRGPDREEMEIWLKADLPLEEKIEVMAHEVGHLALSLLKIEPYQRLTHEPTASLLGHCLVAALREDYGNPFFKIGGIGWLS